MKTENRIVLDGGMHKTLYGKIVDTLNNKYCAELSNYRSIPYHIDIHGKFHLADYIREQIELGIINQCQMKRLMKLLIKNWKKDDKIDINNILN